MSILGVLGIVAVGCLAIIGGSGTDTASSSNPEAPTAPEEPGQDEVKSPEPPPEPEPEPEPAPEEEPQGPKVGMNETVRVGDVAWTVTKARQRDEIKEPFGDRKAGNFVVVDFDFTNEAPSR